MKQKVKVPAVRFTDNKDGTITDAKTGLIWVKNPHTDLLNQGGGMTQKQAIDACKKLHFAGHKDWRLPTVEELSSIVDYARGVKSDEPAIDTKFFPDTKCSWYWTSTPCAWNSSDAWYVGFSYGVVHNGKDINGYVRPVRSSQ